MQHTAVEARFRAIEEVSRRKPRQVADSAGAGDSRRPSRGFGSLTFSVEVMRERLSSETFKALQRTIRRGEPLAPGIAGEVAHALKEWALDNGATHFCHWFQPQTGLTAEKHDSFLSFDSEGVPVERFSASQIIQSEPDASSFPSGGMRSTFEARGYTAWDPTSPIFLMEGPNGRTLCIPSVFISYHGQALDKKAPLLRSMDAIGREALAMLELLGSPATRVVPTVGAEQEFFLIDRAFYQLRPDLVACGRTLLGAAPAKGQQLEDHYFGSIKARVLAYLQEVEHELYRLGVPAKTRHNEVAPCQFEIAPIFEEANVASDHNQLLMEVLRSVAPKHDLALLLHEKPFAGVNGSGKHCNWALGDNRGRNLLEPGGTVEENRRFLVFLLAVLKGVQRRAGLLRASVAVTGNDHRLGANEAPPAIISVFLGSEISRLLDALAEGLPLEALHEDRSLSLNIAKLPDLARDSTDRNRTSPFAFTGSKFEFRAVASSEAIATPMTYLNAAVAEALRDLRGEIQARIDAGEALDAAVDGVLRDTTRATRAIRFDGNNYEQAWVEEAARRGLPNLPTVPDALAELRKPEALEFFESMGVYRSDELASRYHVKMERYVKDLLIEVNALRDIVRTAVLPVALEQQRALARSLEALRGALGALPSEEAAELVWPQQRELLRVGRIVAGLHAGLATIDEGSERVLAEADPGQQGRLVVDLLRPALQELRSLADELESGAPDSSWPLPKYREMLLLI